MFSPQRNLNSAGAALALCFVVASAPILVATLPPIMDFPNHLARIWLMAQGAQEAPLDQIYSIDLAKAGANVGVDLAAATLARVLPIFVVGKLLVAMSVLGPPLGGLALSRALSGRFHPLQIALLSLAWSTTAIAGFVNFQISLGLALLGAAMAARRLDRPVAGFALHLVFATALLFIHPLGMLFYAGTVAALRLGPSFANLFTRGTAMRMAPSILGLALALAVPIALTRTFLKTAARPLSPFWGDARNIYDPIHALTILLSPVLSYDLAIDLAAAAPVAALVVYALAARLARPHAGLTLAAGALFALSPFAPDAIGDGSWLPQRLPIMAALLFLAGLTPRPAAEARPWATVAFALPVLARSLWIGAVWMARQNDVAGLSQALADVSPGAAVVVLQQETRDWRQAPTGRFMIGSPNGVRAVGRHLGALAVIERRAFIPTLFSVPGQHALVVKPNWRVLAVEASAIPYPRQLGEVVSGDPYLKDWRAHFAYVLLLNADLPAASRFGEDARDELEPIADGGFARLYKVTQPISERDGDDPLN